MKLAPKANIITESVYITVLHYTKGKLKLQHEVQKLEKKRGTSAFT